MLIENEVIPTAPNNFQSRIEHPTDADCLCGKDTTFGRHPGNRTFRQKILQSLPLFMAAYSKTDKMKVTKSIFDYMKRNGSRFLKLKNDGSWVEIDKQAARDKVSHALRFAARQQKKQGEDYSSDDSSFSTNAREGVSLDPIPIYQNKDIRLSKTTPLMACNHATAMHPQDITPESIFGKFFPVTEDNQAPPPNKDHCAVSGRDSDYHFPPGFQPFGVDDGPQQIDLSSDEIAQLIAL